MAGGALQERTTQLIEPLIPSDAEERVFRAFKQWNQIVREHIRNATGLKLSDADGARSIPVKVVKGFPQQFAELIDQNADPVLWRLIIGQPKIGSLVEGSQFLLEAWDEIEQWPKLPAKWRRMKRSLEKSKDFGLALQKLTIAEQVRKQIKKIDKDILGAYFFNSPHVELYWIPIAMVAAMIDVRIEDLTLVVLIHELAHGYSHIGRDIDGGQWNTKGFGDSCPEVLEGLAQFYTHVITESMENRTPGPKAAYERFLEMQSGPYLTHKTWLKRETSRVGEIVRFTMVAARNTGSVDHKTWKRLMTRTSGNLVKATPQAVPRNDKPSDW
jgi:hypothetical protein